MEHINRLLEQWWYMALVDEKHRLQNLIADYKETIDWLTWLKKLNLEKEIRKAEAILTYVNGLKSQVLKIIINWE